MPGRIRLAHRMAIGLVCLFLFLFGTAHLYLGTEAIRSGHFDGTWRSRKDFSLGPIVGRGAEQREEVHLRDSDAVRMGVGITALGAMLIHWGLGLFLPSLSTRVLGLGMNKRKVAMILLSLTLLLTTAICFCPPWRIGVDASSTTFWCTIAAYSTITWRMFSRTAQPVDRKSVGRFVFIATAIAALAVGHFIGVAAIGIIFGFWLFVIAGIHIYFLTPRGRSVYDWNSLS